MRHSLPELNQIQNDTDLKACCAAVYQSQWAQLLLGNTFHPGGLDLTCRLGELLHLQPGDRVLDVASGRGTSALFLAQTFGCDVVGVEYGGDALVQANRAAEEAGLAGQVQFRPGDAEQLPFPDNAFDAVICECAFCTFPDKSTAASEMVRILKQNGRLGLSDLTRSGSLPPKLNSLIAWIACIADAQSLEAYASYLTASGVQLQQVEEHNEALAQLIREVRSKLLAAELMVKVKKLDLLQVDFDQARTIAHTAAETVRQGKLGYALLTGIKSI